MLPFMEEKYCSFLIYINIERFFVILSQKPECGSESIVSGWQWMRNTGSKLRRAVNLNFVYKESDGIPTAAAAKTSS
jgi:hypothetical protein